MSFQSVLDLLNDNVGVTVLISSITFGINEWIKTKNSKNLQSHALKIEKVITRTYETEEQLFALITKFTLDNDHSEHNCISYYERIRSFIINEDLFLNRSSVEIALKFSDYILETNSSGRDYKLEHKLRDKYKSKFRS